MTDKQFGKLLTKLNRAHGLYYDLLYKAEEEYKKRFGNYPSDVDDDWWIDSFCQSPAGSTLANVLKHGTLANDR